MICFFFELSDGLIYPWNHQPSENFLKLRVKIIKPFLFKEFFKSLCRNHMLQLFVFLQHELEYHLHKDSVPIHIHSFRVFWPYSLYTLPHIFALFQRFRIMAANIRLVHDQTAILDFSQKRYQSDDYLFAFLLVKSFSIFRFQSAAIGAPARIQLTVSLTTS